MQQLWILKSGAAEFDYEFHRDTLWNRAKAKTNAMVAMEKRAMVATDFIAGPRIRGSLAIRFIFCTACEAAPLSRLSRHAMTDKPFAIRC